MTKPFVQHTEDGQLVYGLPKHMSATASSAKGDTDRNEMKTYWRYHPKPQACEKCQALKGLWFEENPGPVHPNCKCEIEKFTIVKVTGRAKGVLLIESSKNSPVKSQLRS